MRLATEGQKSMPGQALNAIKNIRHHGRKAMAMKSRGGKKNPTILAHRGNQAGEGGR